MTQGIFGRITDEREGHQELWQVASLKWSLAKVGGDEVLSIGSTGTPNVQAVSDAKRNRVGKAVEYFLGTVKKMYLALDGPNTVENGSEF